MQKQGAIFAKKNMAKFMRNYRRADFLVNGGVYPFFSSSLINREELLDLILNGDIVVVSTKIEIAIYTNGQKIAVLYSYCPN